MRVWAALLLAAALGCSSAQAQDTIRLVVPFAAGGPVDAMARLLAQEMQGPLGATIVIENRGGAGGMLGATTIAQSPPDGYAFLVGTGSTLGGQDLVNTFTTIIATALGVLIGSAVFQAATAGVRRISTITGR